MSREPTGPLLLDFVVCEALPFTHVRLAESFVDDQWTNTNRVGNDRRGLVSTLQVAACNYIECPEFLRRSECLLSPFISEGWICLTLPLAQCIPLTFAVSEHEDSRG